MLGKCYIQNSIHSRVISSYESFLWEIQDGCLFDFIFWEKHPTRRVLVPFILDVDNLNRKKFKIQNDLDMGGKADGRKREVFTVKLEDEEKEMTPQNCNPANSMRRRKTKDARTEQADNVCCARSDAGRPHLDCAVSFRILGSPSEKCQPKIASFPKPFSISRIHIILFISVTSAGPRWQRCSSLSYKVKAIMSQCRAKHRKEKTHTRPHCVHIICSKINLPATYGIIGKGGSEGSTNQGRITGNKRTCYYSFEVYKGAFLFSVQHAHVFIVF